MIEVLRNARKIAFMNGEFIKRGGAAFFLIAAFFLLAADGQNKTSAEITRVDVYVKKIERQVGKNKPHLIFADTSDYNEGGKPNWRKFPSEKALETFREKTETYTIAYNWRVGGKLAQANFTRFSPSGDWTQYDNYYFRADGTLAKVASELRTFYGELIVLRDFYFDNKGKLLRQTTKYRDLTTNKPVQKPKDIDFSGSDVKIYKTVRRLPFAKLIK